MQSGPPTGWSPEGVRKIDRCNVFFHRGRTSSNEPGNRSSRNREKNPKHSWFTGSNPDAVQSTGCSPDHRPDGVRKVSGKSIGAMFFFIGAEPRVMNQEIDQAETEKKTQNIPGSPDRTSDAVQSTGCSPDHRPDGVRKVSGKSIGAMFFFIGAEPRVMNQEIDQAETEKKPKTFLVHRIEPGCSPIDRMQSGPPTGWSPEGVRKIDRCNVFFHRGRTSSNEPNREPRKKPKTFGSPDRTRMQSNRPDAVRTTDWMESIGAMFFFIGAEPRVMNQEIDRAETEKKTQNIPGSPDRNAIDRMSRTTDRWSPEKIDR